ncbi:hypothetical protein R3P38DRAFT_2433767, partial [Favolaschia claudopus]
PTLLTAAACAKNPNLQKARTAIQTFVTKSYREVVGVSAKDSWLDPAEDRTNETTGEVYLTPDFTVDVSARVNRRICVAVCTQVLDELKHSYNQPNAVCAVNCSWNREIIQQMADNSFRNLKPDWKKQNDAAALAKNELKKKINRWVSRRKIKQKQIQPFVKKLADDHGLDAEPLSLLLYEEHMSDEASGPDSEDEYESKAAWQRDMARVNGDTDVTAGALATKAFLEVIEPTWRGDTMSDFFHCLQKRWIATLEDADTRRIAYTRVRGTGRKCRRIPAASPYDIGINTTWLAEARTLPENEDILSKWATYGNPAGFDVEALRRALAR